MRYRYWITLVGSLLLALIFLSSGMGKLLGQGDFLLSIQRTNVLPAWVVPMVASWLPWVELALGIALLAGFAVQLASLLSAALITAFIFHNSWMISQGHGYEPCHCLGVLDQFIENSLSTTGSLYIDIGMFVLALLVYFGYRGRFLNLKPWYLKKGQAGSSTGNEVTSAT